MDSSNSVLEKRVPLTFSVVIPCYNESEGLSELIAKCELAAKLGNGEFILVDNGSTDLTSKIFSQELISNIFVKFITISHNQGYGFGITEGLKATNAKIVGWTHADLQCDPFDVLRAVDIFNYKNNDNLIFIKGKRFGRPLADQIFTAGMSIFESLLTGKVLRDINAQPTLFRKDFLNSWENPPKDFALDLHAYFTAKKLKYRIIKLPVIFAPRKYGVSNWNLNLFSKWKFISRTLKYSFAMRFRSR